MSKKRETPEGVPNQKEQQEITRQIQILECLYESLGDQLAIARRLGRFRSDFLSKAVSPKYRNQRKFNYFTREKLIEAICREFQIKEVIVEEKGCRIIRVDPTDEAHVYLSFANMGEEEIAYRGIIAFSADWSTATIYYFYQDGTEARAEHARLFADDVAFYLLVDPAVGDGSRDNHALFIFSKPQGALTPAPYFDGLFATLSVNHRPVSGEMVLKFCKDMAAARTLINRPADAAEQLFFRQPKISIDGPLPSESERFPGLDQQRKLQAIAGLYLGLFPAGQDAPRPVAESFFQILENGRVRFKCGTHHNDFRGRVVLQEGNTLLVYPDSGIDHHGQRLLALRLDGYPLEGNNHMVGIYAGIEDSRPFSYPIVFHSFSQGDFPALTPKLYTWEDCWAMEGFQPFHAFLRQTLEFQAAQRFKEQADGRTGGAHLKRDLSDWAGLFEAYVMAYDREMLHLQCLILELRKDGVCTLKSSTRLYTGHFQVQFEGQLLSGEFEFDEQERSPRFFIMLNARRPLQTFLTGIFSGKDPRGNYVMAGSVILFPLDPSQPVGDGLIRDFILSPESFRELSDRRPQLLDFFLGRMENPIPSYQQLLDAHLIPVPHVGKDLLRRVEGVYYSLKLNSKMRAVNVNPLLIEADGRLRIKSTRQKHNFYHGIAEVINGDVLSLQIHRIDEQPYHGLSLFGIANLSRGEFDFLTGVASSISGNGSPRCGREVLIKVDLPFEKLAAVSVPIPVEGVSSPEYWKLERMYKGVMTYLTGTENNLIKAAGQPKDSFIRNNDYGRIFFSAACHEAQYGDPQLAESYLREAVLHGFNRHDLLDQAIIRIPLMKQLLDKLGRHSFLNGQDQ